LVVAALVLRHNIEIFCSFEDKCKKMMQDLSKVNLMAIIEGTALSSDTGISVSSRGNGIFQASLENYRL
jgi:hypothetical protein